MRTIVITRVLLEFSFVLATILSLSISLSVMYLKYVLEVRLQGLPALSLFIKSFEFYTKSGIRKLNKNELFFKIRIKWNFY